MRKPLSKRKEYNYIKKVIDSCQNHLHLHSVANMIANFQRTHGKQEFTWLTETDYLWECMVWRKEKIEYMNKTNLRKGY